MSTDMRTGQQRSRAARRLLLWLGAAIIVALVASVGYLLAMRSEMRQLHEEEKHRLDMVTAGLDAELARFEYLPSLLETSPIVLDLLSKPGDAALQQAANQYLRRINDTAGANNLYVIDEKGLTLAASDAAEPGSPLGTNLSFRPYVSDALATGRGRFFGVGYTSGKAGYYLSYALRQGQRLRGIATVKVSLEQAEHSWGRLPGDIAVTDEHGVVILSTRADWKYRPTQALSPAMAADIAKTQPYGKAGLQPLQWLEDGSMVAGMSKIKVHNTGFVASSRVYGPRNWHIFALDNAGQLQRTGLGGALTAALAGALLLLAGLLVMQRRRTARLKLANQAALQAAHDSLESKVAERTEELRTAHNELLHASKMAVLGQMSAGMVHELNQPLAALRTMSDNACVLLEHQRLDDVRGNLQRIALLVDRLGKLTFQLRSFSYKSAIALTPVSIAQAVANAQIQIAPRLHESGTTMEVNIEPPLLAALAEHARLEQVLVNLFGNAMEAMDGSSVRCLQVNAHASGERCLVTVTDTGPGVAEDIFPRLFDPFTTTKPIGKGLGLGLMISAHIIREFGGTLGARNLPQGGASFTIDLSLVQPAKESPS